MAGFTSHLAQAVINHFFRNNAQTGPTAHYVTLLTGTPADETTSSVNAVEAAWTAYARKAIVFEAISGATDDTTANTAQITFPEVAGVGSINITGWALYDALTSGNALATGMFPTARTLTDDDVFVINTGDLVLQFD